MKYLSFFVVMALAGCASKPSGNTPVSNTKPCRDCSDENKIVTIFENGLIPTFYIQGHVNGQSEKFFLDTGSARSILLTNANNRTLPAQGTAGFTGFSLEPHSCDWIKVDSFGIGGIHFSKSPFLRCEKVAHDMNNIGVDYFRHSILTLSFEKAHFSLRDPLPKHLATYTLRMNKAGLIMMPVQVGNQSVETVFDTGCGLTVIDEAVIKAHPEDFEPVMADVNGQNKQVEAPFYDATGKNFPALLYTGKHLKVGDIELNNVLMAVAPFSKEQKERIEASMILGANAILAANWYFDFKRKVWGSTAIPVPVEDKNGMQVHADQVVRDDRKLTLTGSATIRHGVVSLAGEKIERLDDGSIECHDDCVFNDGVQEIRGKHLKFVVTKNIWKIQQ